MRAKAIRFRGQIKSSGIVNFDSRDAKWLLQKAKSDSRSQLSHNNVKVAKHAILKIGETDKGDPILSAVLKISKDCIRQALFVNDQPCHNPAIVHANKILINLVSSVAGLTRGYLFADLGIKKKSPVYISDAVQTSGNISTFDIGTMNAPKESKESGEDTSGLTMHYKETIAGITTYEFEGAIDLTELQFISLSEMYDRKAIDPNYLEAYLEGLTHTLGSPTSGKKFYIKSTAVNGLPEEGILLNSDQVKVLVKELFDRLLDLEIIRGASGRAWLSDLEACVKTRGTVSDEWFKVSNTEDVIEAIGEVGAAYTAFSEEEAIKLYAEIDKGKARQSTEKKSKKENKKKS